MPKLKDVHRRMKLTTDCFQTYFKGPDNKIAGFVHIRKCLTKDSFTT